jgi:hypothetical protein
VNKLVKNSHQIIKVLGDKIIDYAGMFPPASLDLKSAFLNYLNYQTSPSNWMLSKFVISARMLPDLGALIDRENISLDNKLYLSILGGAEVALSGFYERLSEDLNDVFDFKSKFGGNVIAETYEVKIPLELFVIPDNQKLLEFFRKVSGSFFDKLKMKVSVFYEIMPNKDLVSLAASLSNFNLSGNFAGYKLRTGGTETSSFPPSEKVAHAIKICRDHDTPVKCTAGLHHPFRHYDTSVKTKMHGFMNVFCAGIFSYSLDLGEHELTRMILDENTDSFKFSDDAISWDIYEVFKEEISDARERFMISFGSCSFDDPIGDLKGLNLL